ncbi:O-methyltransferase [Marinobacter pelagius]|uniref:O-methyltransferase n=2 Tax=Marinobacter pelagius TaxID=379482 RepID=A0A1I4V187_9GAMM|nr:O-methyltransferase [Marinobacter pelagius]
MMPIPEIRGEIVHVTRDALGNILVIDDRKHRVLSFDSIFEQSKIARATPYLPVHEYSRAMLIPAAFTEPAHVTVLGLGGGALAHGLYRLFPECRVHVIELRPKVLEIAREWFALPDSDRMEVTIADARKAVAELPPASTNMIFTDLYNADRMSPAQAQRRFIKDCCTALTDNGWLILNYHKVPDESGSLFRELVRQFPCLLYFHSKTNNTVIYGCKEPFYPWPLDVPHLKELEERLPIGWRKLMKKLSMVED